jgi:DNA polymerase-3 subunit delta
VLATPLKGALIAWIAARAKKIKLEIAPDATKLLSEIFPDDPPAIASELEKLVMLEGKIDAETVKRVVNHLPPTTIFAVQDAIAAKKPLEASEHLEQLLNAGEDPFKLLGGIQAQYNLLARAFALRERDPMLGKDEAGKALSVHPFRAEKALFAAKKLTERKLKTDLEHLLDADVGMKSGLDPRVTLERLILELSL